MRTLSAAALLVLSSMAGLMYAQARPQRTPAEVNQILLQRRLQQHADFQRELKSTCSLPDGSNQPLNAVTSYEGQTYRCVEALRSDGVTLTTYAAGWVKVSPSN